VTAQPVTHPVADEAGQVEAGGRRVARPRTVETCRECGRPVGAGYADCPVCFEAVEGIWLADWQALLAQEGIEAGTPDEKLLAQVVISEFGRHPWTVMDIAMSLLRCGTCGGELGEAYADCAECGQAFGASLASEFGATANEHALHVGRWVLRFPHRNSPNVVTAWRSTLPRLLTGWLPTTRQAQSAMALIRAGRLEEVQAGLRQVDEEIRGRHGSP
jgi:uncharacterized protein (UPF0212 family)